MLVSLSLSFDPASSGPIFEVKSLGQHSRRPQGHQSVPEAIVVEDFIGRDKADVRQEGVRFTFIGEGDTVIDQLPAGGTTLSEEGRVWIYLGEDTFE